MGSSQSQDSAKRARLDDEVARQLDGPLAGASICLLGASDAGARVRALGGAVAEKVEDSTHVVVRTGIGMDVDKIDPSVRTSLLLAQACSVAVVEASWIDDVARLPAEAHWSDAAVDAHIPPVLALLDEDGRAEQRRARLQRGRSRRHDTTGELATSLDETWAFLTKEKPHEAESAELRRAIEMSLLDSALTLRLATAGEARGPAAQTPEQVLPGTSPVRLRRGL